MKIAETNISLLLRSSHRHLLAQLDANSVIRGGYKKQASMQS
jgi:hypothetical protein